jgi:hypothetical protein
VNLTVSSLIPSLIPAPKKRLAQVRVYPGDIQACAAKLGALIDAMMAESELLQIMAELDVRAEVSKLGARLVNEVLLVPGQVSDDEARTRLGLIEKDAFALKSKFDQAGIVLGERPWLASVESLRDIPRVQAEALISDFNQAFALYPSLVDRYGKLQGTADIGTKLSRVLGSAGPNLLGDLGSRLSEVDRDMMWQKAAYDKIQTDLNDGGSTVAVDVSMYVRMANWPSDVFRIDEGLKRLEGAGLQKRAEATIPTRKSPWKTIALASSGLAAVGAILYMATRVQP